MYNGTGRLKFIFLQQLGVGMPEIIEYFTAFGCFVEFCRRISKGRQIGVNLSLVLSLTVITFVFVILVLNFKVNFNPLRCVVRVHSIKCTSVYIVHYSIYARRLHFPKLCTLLKLIQLRTSRKQINDQHKYHQY